MARNTTQTCRAILELLQARGCEFGATRKELMDAIVEIAGSTRETRDRYMTALKRNRYISQNGVNTYTLNFETAESPTDLTLIGDLTVRVDVVETTIKDLLTRMEALHNAR